MKKSKNANRSSRARSNSRSARNDVAIIGMGGRFPQAKNLEEFWSNLTKGVSSITEMPAGRRDSAADGFAAGDVGRSKTLLGGFIDDVDCFDSSFFGISPKEAELMDPQQRLLLEIVWHTLEDARIKPSSVAGSNTGVFIGACNVDYSELVEEVGPRAGLYATTGTFSSLLSNRVSFIFDWRGPSLTVDTACSSSLVAVHLAVKAIQDNECEMAIAGGVNICWTAKRFVAFGSAGMLSVDGQCKAFDAKANGYVRGEGIGAVLFKPLARAISDGNHIYSVIKGSAVNHGGKTRGITVTSPAQQCQLLIDAYRCAGVHPESVGYIEAHGTGTSLGDPIEFLGLKLGFASLCKQLGETNAATNYCALGSVKTNIGHLEAAAGIVGLIKTVLALNYKVIPASLNLKELNSLIKIEGSPFYIPTNSKYWEPLSRDGRTLLRTAGVSSFGFGGAYAHVVVEEFDNQKPQSRPHSEISQLVVLSARNVDRLHAYAATLIEYLEAHYREAPISLVALAYSLHLTRNEFEERVAFIVTDNASLIGKLQQFINGDSNIGGCFAGKVKKNKETVAAANAIDSYINERALDSLAELWVKGVPIDWASLYAKQGLSAIPLPRYPFAKERHWVTNLSGTTDRQPTSDRRYSMLHPLLQKNTSDFNEQRFSSTFSGAECFLSDHVVNGNKVLPGVCYLEMARAAVVASVHKGSSDPLAVKFANVVWSQPVMVEEAKEVHIGLYPQASGEIEYEIYSIPSSGELQADAVDERVHSQGRAQIIQPGEVERLDVSSLQEGCDRHLDVAGCYAAFSAMGIEYGPAHRGLERVSVGNDVSGHRYVVAQLKLPECVSATREQYVLHPSVLDCALQASIGLMLDGGELSSETKAQPLVPFAVESVEIRDRSPVCGYAYIRESAQQSRDSQTQKLDIDLCDESGRVCIRLKGFTSRVMASAAEEQSSQTLLLRREWAVSPASIGQTAIEQSVSERERVVLLDALYKECVPALQAQWPGMKIELLALSPASDPLDTASPAQQVFAQVQALLQSKPKPSVQLQVVLSSESNRASLLSAVSGLLKSAQLENPKLIGQVMELSAGLQAEQLVQLLTENAYAAASDDTEIRYRGEVREVVRYREQASISASSSRDTLPWKDAGVYLITGGAGGLGLIFAQEITRTVHAATLVLTGRSLLSEEQQAQIEALQTNGARVVYRPVDVTDAGAVTALIDDLIAQYGHLNGIVHSAGVIHDNFIIKKTEEEFRAVLAPKMAGTVNLDQATQDVELDFLILFSSIAGVFGNVGQSDYALANAFMDRYASYRNELVQEGQRQGRTLSINWPLWEHGGMHIDAASLVQMKRQGLTTLSTDAGIAALYAAYATDASQVVVVAGERRKLKGFLGLENAAIKIDPRTVLAATSADSVEETSDMTGLLEQVQSALIQLISQQLKVKADDIDAEAELSEFGFDSISLTAFGNTLNQRYGLELSPTIFFEYPTIASFTAYLTTEHTELLADKLAVRKPAKRDAVSVLARSSAVNHEVGSGLRRRMRFAAMRSNATLSDAGPESIAIIGMSGCFPGARDVDAFWQNLASGADSITEIPASRWDWQALYGDPHQTTSKTNIKWGGFIEGVDEFDPLFFGISPKEAQSMDPQQRLLMTYTWKAIEDAGYSAQSLSGSKTAIFVGTASSGYSDLIAQADASTDKHNSTSGVPSIGPNRMSYLLNLHGPSEPIETACSSSLVAIHRAVRTMQSGDCEMALVGGINTIITPWAHISFSKAGMLCEDGRCKTFSKDANGYVRGEGVGMLFLKKLSHAERDGDHIYGLIKGSSENHGGRANSLTAPNPKAQAELIKAAYREAKIDPRTVSYIEAHGTGTPLGDPIEINGLKSAFSELYQDVQLGEGALSDAYCGIGSVKTNIGHLELAAGVAGVIKVLLQLKHKTLVKSLHCEEINPYIQLQGSPFYLVGETQPWPALKDRDDHELPRRAGISSFGFGGVNAHVIVEEYCVPQQETPHAVAITSDHPALIVLSAKNEERLQQQAKQLLAHIAGHPYTESDLAHIAYTLQVGREAMEHRLALTAITITELQEKLTGYLAGKVEKREIGECYVGQVKRERETLSLFTADEELQEAVKKWVQRGKYTRLLELWVKGLAFEWSTLCGEAKPHRISLPTYPFTRESYWIERDAHPAVGRSVNDLHPLLHLNISNLSEQRFSSTFNGEEFFLRDHRVNGSNVLPGVCYLEMARAAMAASLESDTSTPVVSEFADVVWMQPVIVTDLRKVYIGLTSNDKQEVEFEIYTAKVGADEEEVIHAQGRAVLLEAGSAEETELIDLSLLRSQCDQSIEVAQCYSAFSAMGIEYGPSHRGLTSVQVGTDTEGQRFVLAQVTLPACVSDTQDHYLLHPSVLDSALQASIGVLLVDSDLSALGASVRPALPFALEQLRILDRSPSIAMVVVRACKASSATPALGSLRKLDIDLCDDTGRVCVRFRGLTSRVLETNWSRPRGVIQDGLTEADRTLLLTPKWEAMPLLADGVANPTEYGERWVLIDPIYKERVAELEVQHPEIKWRVLSSEGSAADQLIGAGEQVFSQVQSLLQNMPKQAVLLQVLLGVEAEREEITRALSGLLKSASQENPKLVGQVLTLARSATVAALALAVSENASAAAKNEVEIGYSEGERNVIRFKELSEPVGAATAMASLPWKDGGVYLITGGGGGLGLILAREIASKVQGAKIVLTGRSPISAATQAALEILKCQGNEAHLEYRVLDVSDAAAVTKCVHSLVEHYDALNGIVHCAGVIHDNFIIKKTQEEFRTVLAPKVAGTVNLDQATQDVALDFLILFSSMTGAFGNVGQCDYALANAFMDRYATYRNELVEKNQRHGRTLSINWPLWKNGGMQVDEATLTAMRCRGLGALTTANGIDALCRAWASDASQVVVLTGDRPKLRSLVGLASEGARVPGYALDQEAAPMAVRAVVIEENGDVVDTATLLEKVRSALTKLISKELKVRTDDIDLEAELSEFGFDSISLTAFGNTLNQTYGLELSPTIFFEYPTVASFTAYLTTEHTALLSERFTVRAIPKVVALKSTSSWLNHTPTNTVVLADSFARRRRNGQFNSASAVSVKEPIVESIAIIGMSGCFPGANNLDLFWENLKSGKDSITEIPASRWDWQALYGDPHQTTNKTNIKWGGFIEGVDEFDPLFFGISPKEAQSMDPQQRLLMTYGWKAIEDAGYSAQSLSGSKTAIFVGTAGSGYSELAAQANTSIEGHSSTGVVSSIGPNRMSYLLNFHGPSEPIETACSSSLVAIHRAVRAMQSGDCEMALVGGINTIITPWAHISFGKAGMLCEDGRCKTFSKDANGYVRGEGVGMLFLKKISHAERDGDHIYGLIKGSGENHGGRANSLTAPNPKAQAELIKAAYREAKIDPRSITYVEAHGTGTPLGDPIEINGLKSVFAELYTESGTSEVPEGHCGLGSVKTNIGHLELAAGVAGVIKVLLQLKHKTLVKSLHCEEISPYIQLQGSPFYLVRETQPWTALKDRDDHDLPRRAGVSSFGFGGVNAHVIVEEYCVPQEESARAVAVTSDHPALMVLSAKNEDRLQQQAKQLLAHIAGHPYVEGDLAHIAYTLQVGREAMEHRLAFTAITIADLKEKLSGYVEGKAEKGEIENFYRGEVKKNKETLSIINSDDSLQRAINTWVEQGKYAKLLELWVKGLVFDWTQLYTTGASYCAVKTRRISLPTYPFSQERYWISETAETPATRRAEEVGHSRLVGGIDSANRQYDPSASRVVLTKLTSDADESTFLAERAAPFKSESLHFPSRSLLDTGGSGARSKSLDELTTELIGSLAGTLYLNSADIDVATAFNELGLDSITGVEWTHGINQRYAISLTATRLYDYPNIKALANYLVTQIPARGCREEQIAAIADLGVDSINDRNPAFGSQGVIGDRDSHTISEGTKSITTSPRVNQMREDSIAIIGVSGAFPQAKNVDEFWSNIAAGRDCISEIPPERWSIDLYYDPNREAIGKSYSKWMGVMDEVDCFDPLFFGISPMEAYGMDPQQRLFLEHCWSCIEDAGLNARELSGSRCGVYVGCSPSSYGQFAVTSELTVHSLTGSATSILSARIAYFLDLKGPCLAIDTACSSSLVAIAEACDSLVLGRSDMTLAGGVCVLVGPNLHIASCKAGMLSETGRCYTFDTRADGFVPADGVGVVLLKRLSEALRDQNKIQGVIRGWEVNQDGKTNGIAAPSVVSQALLEKSIYERFQINPESISLVEAHGTGTKLGDPIEVEALIESFRSHTSKENYCSLGSIKTNIGHTLAAAGVAGVIKVLLALRHRMLPPISNFQGLNEHVALSGSPFYINTHLQPWQSDRNQPRRAAVSSFGFSGTNAHVVIEEYVPSVTKSTARAVDSGRPVIVVLSAKAPEQLRARAERLKAHLEGQEDIDLADVAYTLQVGREAMEHRIAMVVDSLGQLLKTLTRYIETQSAEGLYTGQIKNAKEGVALLEGDEDGAELLQTWIRKRKLKKLAELWVKGVSIEWLRMHGDPLPQSLTLPTYPFARKKYWIRQPQVVERALQVHSEQPNSVALRSLRPLHEVSAIVFDGSSNAGKRNSTPTTDVSVEIDSRAPAMPIRPLRLRPAASIERLEQELVVSVAALLYMEVADVDREKPFVEMGLDSVVAVEWMRVVNARYGLSLMATKLYDYPTIKALTGLLVQEQAQGREEELSVSIAVVSGQSDVDDVVPRVRVSLSALAYDADSGKQLLAAGEVSAREPRDVAHQERVHCVNAAAVNCDAIAIIGMSGRYPGACDLNEYWENLAAGRDCIEEVPLSRWDVNEYYDPQPGKSGKTYCKWLGRLADVESFDPLFFNISPAEAQWMDPQHRLFLEESYKAFEDSGYNPKHLSNTQCGVYLGMMGSEYAALLERERARGDTTGNSAAIGAARIAYYLNLKGPAIPIDTACSSSLVATHLACQALRANEIEMALVGGVTLYLTPESYIGMCSAGMLSAEGRCKTFDNSADGFVPGEGVGALVLKRLSDAQTANDRIYGVIIGSGINQDGKTNGITAPSAMSQMELERGIYARYKINPESISYVEMHGTGTKLGDPIELDALSTVFKEKTAKTNYCALGSVKSNIGHTSAAAGVASMHKVLLALKHRELVPTLNYEIPNEHFDFANSPFFVNTERRSWSCDASQPRRAAVSSFGFSGTNAHVIIEEYVESRANDTQFIEITSDHPVLILLSAKNEERLQQQAKQLLIHIKNHVYRDRDLLNIAYTLQAGREAMEQRLAFTAATIHELQEKLTGYTEGNAETREIERFYRGEVKKHKEALSIFTVDDDLQQAISTWIEKGKYAKLLELWVKGLSIDWNRLYSDNVPQRISLPTYPFAKERYWIDPGLSEQRIGIPAAVLHPLLHRNTSDVSGLRFSSTFSGGEFFLSDHAVKGGRVLPGVAYLEMARAAVVAAAIDQGNKEIRSIVLKNVVWLRPITVNETPVVVHIGLSASESDEIVYEIYSTRVGDEQSDEHIVHSQGQAYFHERNAQTLDRLDVPALQLICNRRIEPSQCYAVFNSLGIEYGAAYQGIEALYVGSKQVLAKLHLPVVVATKADQFILHPSLLDSAFQASVGLLWGDDKAPSADHAPPLKPSLLFALESIDVFGSFNTSLWAWMRINAESTAAVRKLDLDLCDEAGAICAQLRGISFRVVEGELSERVPVVAANESAFPAVAEAVDGLMLVPKWEALRHKNEVLWPKATDRVVLVGVSECEQYLLQQQYPSARRLILELDASIDAQTHALSNCGPIDHLFWFAPNNRVTSVADEVLLEQQRAGIVSCFRFIKALLQLGYADRALGLTVVTVRAHAIRRDESIDPMQASIQGFIGSLAKECGNWKIRLMDVESRDTWPLDELVQLPADPHGNAQSYRDGEWYRQQLVPCEVKKPKAPAFRSGGIYVVIGGAGGIGEVLSEYLIREYQSQVIWIGRRALDIPIQEKLDRLSVFGPAPLYMSADATDRTALAHAYREIKTRYARIHGVIHSTIVMSGNDLAHMDEAHFAAGLAAKLDVSVRMAQVFAQESVEFVLFLSSIQSFEKNARQSNYAAGCTFTDAFASRLAAEWACPVKVMNWGYWGSIGLASTYKSFQHWLAQAGMGSIEPAEGMRALEALLESSFNQLAYVKITRPQAMAAMASDERIVELSGSIYPINAVSLLERTSAVSRVGVRPTDASERSFTLDGALAKVLFSQLQSAGLFVDSQSVDSTSAMLQWKQHTQLSTVYDRWLTETIRVLGEHGYLHEVAGSITVVDSTPLDHAAVWSWWEEQKISWQADATLKAQVNLVAATLLALPEILSGKKPATDILFPNSSMDRVEGIYKNNPVSDYFNEVLAEAVVAYVEERVKLDPAARIRILEIGAGTGGTSAVVFAKLAPYQAHIEEYCYTDISKAFLMYGQERFGQEASYLTFRLFNVEQPLESQAMQAGEYDVVIAANALHATKNIRSTLRNAKATLKRCGLLVLNEFCGHSLFAHLTFGLLDGWWSYDDAAIRIPGTPGLSPESWHRVLAGEGFESIVFPAQTSHDIGQQIIVAYSNGVIRQKHLAAMSFPAPRLSERSSSLMSHPRAVGVVKSLQSEESVDAATLAEQVREVIVETLANSLKIDVAIIDADESFADYGLDSIIGVQTIEQINELLGTELTTTSVFDYSTVNKLMAHIISEYRHRLICKLTEASATQLAPATAKVMTKPIATRRFIGAAKSPGAVTEPAAAAITGEEEKIGALSQSPLRREPIAIIGMSGRYAKANSVYELWDYLASGTDLIEEVTRWDLSQHFVAATTEGNGYCGHGGFLKDIDQFDPLFFNISGIEATYMDPQQRLFLEESWKALEDAGYAGASSEGSRCSVYVGYNSSDYQQLFKSDPPAQAMWGNAASVLSARIAYYLNLQGPAMTIDSACSSSLVAIHLACQSLWSQETDLGIAGGVFVQCTPSFYLSANRTGMLSPTGRCHTFDDRADGFVPGEGVGVVVLKRLSDALRAGDHIDGVICGSGINQDGATNGITAPSALSQQRLERQVYETFGIHPEQIQMVEAHGTGTKLGDPIEFQALTKAFRQDTDKNYYCALGSIKTNIGHTTAASGVAGVIKILLSLQHKQIPASLHYEKGNSHIDFSNSPFYVNTALKEWTVDLNQKRRAAVSSFGMSGTNAHLVIEEAPATHRAHAQRPGYLIALSARTEEQLRRQVEQLLAYCEQHSVADCGNVSYTLLLGRRHFTHRLAACVRSLDELLAQLKKWLEKGKAAHVYVGEVRDKDRREQVSLKRYGNQCIEECKNSGASNVYLEHLAAIADLYVQGYQLNYEHLFDGDGFSRLSLPTYPFAKERYWIDEVNTTVFPKPSNSTTPIVNRDALQRVLDDVLANKMDSNTAIAEAKKILSIGEC